jgi:hypothetical protein
VVLESLRPPGQPLVPGFSFVEILDFHRPRLFVREVSQASSDRLHLYSSRLVSGCQLGHSTLLESELCFHLLLSGSGFGRSASSICYQHIQSSPVRACGLLQRPTLRIGASLKGLLCGLEVGEVLFGGTSGDDLFDRRPGCGQIPRSTQVGLEGGKVCLS